MSSKKKRVTVVGELAAIRGILEAQNATFTDHLEIEGKWQEDIGGKVNRIMNISANGTSGFENVITEMYLVTTGARRRLKIKKYFIKWLDKHRTVKDVLIWVLKKLLTFIIFVIVWLIAKNMGLEAEIIKLLWTLVGKV